jgi:uncharacterized membrane protein (DUF2068 family)
VELHIKILGILYIISGILATFGGTLIILLFTVAGIAAGEIRALPLLAVMATVLGSLFLTIGIAKLICGWGLLARKKWSRVFAIILGIIDLINVPFGTALGIYALWTLFKPEAEELLA